jgi:phosphoribosylaminoimidazole (AIR) synthetase
MGCGFCAIVADEDAGAAAALLERHHPGAAQIGRVIDEAGVVRLPTLGLTFS